MTTWLPSGPICHPWFRQTNAKRKLSAESIPSASPSRSPSLSPPPSPPPKKRQRQHTLEAGFSTLTLANPLSYDSGSSSALPYVSEPISTLSNYFSPMEDDSIFQLPSVVLPSVIEEPLIPEVKMKTSSWYEPEPDRIIITNLDSSSDEEDNESTNGASVSISSALLKKLASRSSQDLTGPANPLPIAGRALVLFKPLSIPDAAPIADKSEEDRSLVDTVDIADVVEDDDAMDVEP